ncbi:MAG: hypothetical protein DMG58_16145 [Acidobacteria bacterium]|nr:MAG: hypothetical protein DMG58_16145 [Acidobacteriota bacterium]
MYTDSTRNSEFPTRISKNGAMASPELVLTGSYDHGLVALSVVIAVLASYTALDLAGRVTATHGRARLIWLAGGPRR